MLTCLSFLVLLPSLNYFSLTHWLSFPLIHSFAQSLASYLPLYSLTGPFTRLLPPSLPHSSLHYSFAHIPARLLACFLPSSLISYHTSLLGCFLFSSFLYPRTRSFACFVPDSLSHSVTFFLFFPHLLARPTASFRVHSLACLHVFSLTRSLS